MQAAESIYLTESGTFSKGHDYTNLCVKLHHEPITTVHCFLQWDVPFR